MKKDRQKPKKKINKTDNIFQNLLTKTFERSDYWIIWKSNASAVRKTLWTAYTTRLSAVPGLSNFKQHWRKQIEMKMKELLTGVFFSEISAK